MTLPAPARGANRLYRLVVANLRWGYRHVVALAAGACFAASAVLVVAANRRLLRLRIEGLSMVPVLAPGDRVLVLRTHQVSVGDIVAFADPDGGGGVLVKRVTGVDHGSVRVEGDNLGASRDSRHFGHIPRAEVIGRVLWCYRSPQRPARPAR